jgi:hypothetical protein
MYIPVDNEFSVWKRRIKKISFEFATVDPVGNEFSACKHILEKPEIFHWYCDFLKNDCRRLQVKIFAMALRSLCPQ